MEGVVVNRRAGVLPSTEFWSGKRVLLTGHSGFKGGWLALWLKRLGAEVTGVALPPSTAPSLFELAAIGDVTSSHFCDIRDRAGLSARVQAAAPEIVLHLAAQPLVIASYREPVDTFATNVMGTAHLLEALRGIDSVRVVVVVTTDKVYRNREWPYPYREDDELGGHDPYSASKAAAELVAASYRAAFLAEQGIALATARAGNVIGGGDWSDDRLIPDAVRQWQAGSPLILRRPHAMRPWQHVLEPLAGYLVLAQRLWADASLAQAWNFGPLPQDVATVGEVAAMARSAYGRGEIVHSGDLAGPHEAGWLALEIAKSRKLLGVSPRWTLEEAVGRTMAWYAQANRGADARALCEADIVDYVAAR